MGAEIRYLLAASGATINDNREAINDATMMSATSELVQEDPMPTRAGSYLAALLRDTQAPRTQAQNTVASLVNAAQTALDANHLFANGTMINKINEAVKIATRPIRAISGIMAEKQRQPPPPLPHPLRTPPAARKSREEDVSSLRKPASQERPAAPAHLALSHDLHNVGSEQALPLRRRRQLAAGPRTRRPATGDGA